MTITKAGKTITIVDGGLSGRGRIVSVCKCPGCMMVARVLRFSALPCGCRHALINQCTCRLRDAKCRGCGRVFVAAGGDWYEVVDPHASDPAARNDRVRYER